MKHLDNIRINAKKLIASNPDTAKIAHAMQNRALTRIVRELKLVEQEKKLNADIAYTESAVKNLIEVCKYPDDLNDQEYIEAIEDGFELRGRS